MSNVLIDRLRYSSTITVDDLLHAADLLESSEGTIAHLHSEIDAKDKQILELKKRCAVGAWKPGGFPPNKETDVLVATLSLTGRRNIDKGHYNMKSNRWVHRGTAEVTHWMPLPTLPEMEDETF